MQHRLQPEIQGHLLWA